MMIRLAILSLSLSLLSVYLALRIASNSLSLSLSLSLFPSFFLQLFDQVVPNQLRVRTDDGQGDVIHDHAESDAY